MTELSKRPNYRADIQGLRGVAVLLVVLFHAGLPVPGGFVGVDIFFVISGYVITEGIVKGLEREMFSFQDFYARRARRLLPSVGLMLGVVLALSPWFAPIVARKAARMTGLSASIFNANHYLLLGDGYFASSVEYNALLHTWSLSVEEQFYIGFPVLLLAFWKIGRSVTGRVRVQRGIVGLSLLSFFLSIWMSYSPTIFSFDGASLAFYTVVSRAWQFGVGALLVLQSKGISASRWSKPQWGWLGAALIVASSLLLDDETVFPGVAVLVPTAGAALMLVSGLRTESQTVLYHALCSRPMTRMGDLSYSWYLWHWPFIVFAAATFPHVPLLASVIAAVVSLAVAVLNERYVELPIRNRERSVRWPATAVFAICVGTPFAVVAFFNPLVARMESTELVSTSNGFILTEKIDEAQREYRSLPCSSGRVPSNVKADCQWGDWGAPDVVLVGDSNAGHWLPMLRELVPSLGMRLTASTFGSCPFVDLDLVDKLKSKTTCTHWSRSTLDDLLQNPPAVLIVSSGIDNYLLSTRHALVDRTNGTVFSNENEKLQAFYEATSATISRLNQVGTTVLLVEPIPKFIRSEGEKVNPFKRLARRRERALALRCSRASILMNMSWCQFSRALDSDEWRVNEPVLAMLANLGNEGAQVVRVQDAVCPESTCQSFSSDYSELLYYDAGHLAPAGSWVARSVFEAALRDVIGNQSSD